MDLLMLQLPTLSPKVVHFWPERLPKLKSNVGDVITSDAGFGDSGIGGSMSSQVQSSQVQSSLASQDQGFTNQSPIPRQISRHGDIHNKDTKEDI